MFRVLTAEKEGIFTLQKLANATNKDFLLRTDLPTQYCLYFQGRYFPLPKIKIFFSIFDLNKEVTKITPKDKFIWE